MAWAWGMFITGLMLFGMLALTIWSLSMEDAVAQETADEGTGPGTQPHAAGVPRVETGDGSDLRQAA